MRFLLAVAIVFGLVACAPSDQGDSGDESFAPSNTTTGVVPHGIPGQSGSSALTEGETSTRGAVSASAAPTAAPGSTGKTGREPAD